MAESLIAAWGCWAMEPHMFRYPARSIRDRPGRYQTPAKSLKKGTEIISALPSHEEKRSDEPGRITWASARFCDSVT